VDEPAADRSPSPPSSRIAFLVRLIDRLSAIGAYPGEPQDERQRAGALILAAVLVSLLSFVWVITYLAYGEPVSAAIPFVYQVATVIGLVALARTRNFRVFRDTQFVLFLVLPAALQLSLGGFEASSGMALWSMVMPLAALAMLAARRAVRWLAAYFVVLLVLALLEPVASRNPADLPDGLRTAFFVLNIAGATLAAFSMLAYFVHQRDLAHIALGRERDRSERLLLNVLPEPIAARLKRHEGDVIADQHDEVTVLFADLVGFTAASADMPPGELVALLDRIFSRFDDVADREGLEKIKTIGDAYMLVGGLPEPRPDHAQAVARAALAIRDELDAIAGEPGCEWLELRIGIDTGPAVAGVIGRRKFIYDLWGDTVNTASRMESHGLPGQIQVSARTAAALDGAFVVEPRGTIEVKGKGPMETFLLVGTAGQTGG
jgi:adenylate cyclase